MEIPFKWYVHDDRAWFEADDLTKRSGYEVTEELAEKMSNLRPFYEVTLECTVNSETGEVTLVSATL